MPYDLLTGIIQYRRWSARLAAAVLTGLLSTAPARGADNTSPGASAALPSSAAPLSSSATPLSASGSSEVSPPSVAAEGYGRVLRFCGDQAGWPPYTYRTEPKAEVSGIDRDFLQLTLGKQGIRFTLDLWPWKRCLHNVRIGKADVAVSASGTAQRRQDFSSTDSYYRLTPSYIYLKERFPEGLNLPPDTVAQRYQVCGLRGYNYGRFGFDSTQVQSTSNTFGQLFKKTAAGRCDLLLARKEIVHGFRLMGIQLLGPQWQVTPVPGHSSDSFVMLVSPAIEDSAEVQQLLNRQIGQATRSGLIQQLQNRYLKAPPLRP